MHGGPLVAQGKSRCVSFIDTCNVLIEMVFLDLLHGAEHRSVIAVAWTPTVRAEAFGAVAIEAGFGVVLEDVVPRYL
jgi:hypothetical protein